jgi:hypothetical protein
VFRCTTSRLLCCNDGVRARCTGSLMCSLLSSRDVIPRSIATRACPGDRAKRGIEKQVPRRFASLHSSERQDQRRSKVIDAARPSSPPLPNVSPLLTAFTRLTTAAVSTSVSW